ncbi:S1 RNA-binding domain-containing protein [Paenibacillus sp. 32O-W]|uniref:CvfB family protein n=1 Tax=Paenibacillus sp. 32O-W TaxID=1695218 RepID=UPI0011A0BA19|nr:MULTISPECIES: S1-like domain-containing RNA-binding protein [Paenibacillaceae]
MNLQAGTVVKLQVAREVSPYGFFLTDGSRDILLHYTEKEGNIEPGQMVEVFLYYDTEDRLAATMKKPLLRLGEVALLEVADAHPRFGLFLDMGIGRQLLLPYRELPELKELRPQVGDRVFVTMAHDRQGRLMAKLAGEKELSPLAVRAPESWKNEWMTARVYKPLQMGTFVIVEGGVLGFGVIGLIHSKERTRLLRVGESVEVRVIHVREDGRVNLSMRLPKEQSRTEDADVILAYLQERPNGAMPYSDQTPADIISSKFSMSKAAFKRALGKLMKDGLIVQQENWTYLQDKAPK